MADKEHVPYVTGDNPTDVYKAEAGAIKERRGVAWPTQETAVSDSAKKWNPQVPSQNDDYVGLALSGGGIRAASLGLGVLQGLCRNGLIRSIDYLSTVSGGGYIGSHFSSLVVTRNKAAEQNKTAPVPLEQLLDKDFTAPPARTKAAGLSSGVRKLIFGGKYLYRPWEATNKYLIGLVLTNLSLLGGLIAFAALVALGWRLLDLEFVRNYLDPFLLNSDVIAAFLLAMVFFVPWIFGWTRYVIQGEAPGKLSQFSFYFMLASLLIGVVLLSVNGKETKVGWIGAILGVNAAAASTGMFSKVLSGLLAAGLLPLLRPDKLIAMGLSQRTFRERVVFRVAMFAFLIGVPLLFIGMIGARNISRTAKDPDSNIRPGDVRNWPAFAAVLCGDYQPKLPSADTVAKSAPAEKTGSGTPNTANSDLQYHVHELLDQRLVSSTKWEEFESSPWYARLWYRISWLAPFANPLSESWAGDRAVDQQAKQVCQIVNEHILPATSVPSSLVKAESLVKATDKQAKLPTLKEIKDTLRLPDDEDTREVLNDAHLSYGTLWRTDDAKTFNQWLLRKSHPECFYTEGGEYRWIVTKGDELTRFWPLGAGALVCLVGLRVNMNRASMHRFYRNRLKHAYIVSAPEEDAAVDKQAAAKKLEEGNEPDGRTEPDEGIEPGDIKLSNLNTTKYGAPYHLLNTTLELTHPTGLDEADKECDNGEIKDRRDRQIFIFSQKYCGATATGWRWTEDYETYLDDNISLADAMALSGAASDAMLTNSLPMTVMLTAFNLTLGQWMPNPAKLKPKTYPRVFHLLREWLKPVKESKYAFVCDGGFTDNLGVFSLLKRRCKVIICLDAGCDSNHEFSDLGGVLRMARIQDGIRIETPFKPKSNETSNGNNGTPADGRALEMRTFETSPIEPNEKGMSKSHFVIGKITYPANDRHPAEKIGWFVYIKPSFTGDEGSDLLGYRRTDCEFPFNTTADQFYDAARFESYRQLGLHMCSDLCNQLSKQPGKSLDEKMSDIFKKLSEPATGAPSLKNSMFRVSRTMAGANKAVRKIAAKFSNGEESPQPEKNLEAVGQTDALNGSKSSVEKIDTILSELDSAICRLQRHGTPVAQNKLKEWDDYIRHSLPELAADPLAPKAQADKHEEKVADLIQAYWLLTEHLSQSNVADRKADPVDAEVDGA